MGEIYRLAERCSVRQSRLLPQEYREMVKTERRSDSSPACVHQVSTCSRDPVRLIGGKAELPNRVNPRQHGNLRRRGCGGHWRRKQARDGEEAAATNR